MARDDNIFERTRTESVEAMQWTEDRPRADLIEFTDHLVRMDDIEREFLYYDRKLNFWRRFEYGWWIVKKNDCLQAWPDESFRKLGWVRLQERW